MRIQASFESAYPHYAQASTGGPSYPAFAVVNEAVNQVQPNQRQQFGDSLVDKFGNVFCYVRSPGTMVLGDLLKRAVAGNTNVPAAGTVSANTTTRRVFTNITTAIDESTIGSFLCGNGGTSPFLSRIKGQVAIGANTTFILSKIQVFFGIGKYDGDELAATPTTSDPVSIVRPYDVNVCGAAGAGNVPVGVSLGTVSAGSGTLIQVQGLAYVKADGTTAITAGGLVTSGAAGVVVAPTATPTAYEVACLAGTSLVALASGTAKIPVALNCLHKL